MKLLYITNQICGSAGLERVLSIKASILADHYNYKVHILTLNQGIQPLFYEFSKNIKYHDIQAHGNPFTYFLDYITGIRKTIKEVDPDIISVCDDGLKGLLLPLLVSRNCPMVYERHVSKQIANRSKNTSLLKSFKNAVVFSLMNFGGSRYDKFVVLTSQNLKEWPLKNTTVIHNPLSFNGTTLNSTLTEKIVLAVGRHDFQKGYDRLLKAWQHVTLKYPDWQLHIYGKKDPSIGLEALATELGISTSLFLYDPVKSISEVYQKASVFVLSSRYEGFGMVLTEAMSHGVPCVSFDCPHGPSDIIDHKENGYLVRNGDINDFALQIENLIGSPELRRTMGEKAVLKSNNYSQEVIIPQWNNLFTNLIANH